MGIDYTFKKKKCACCGHADEIVKGDYGAPRWNDEGMNEVFIERKLEGWEVVDLKASDINKYLGKIKDGQFKKDSIEALRVIKETGIKKVTLLLY